jgi:hypothetical protein
MQKQPGSSGTTAIYPSSSSLEKIPVAYLYIGILCRENNLTELFYRPGFSHFLHLQKIQEFPEKFP